MTWYYVPYTSAPDTEASSWPSSSQEFLPEPWLTLSGTAMQRPLSWRGWKRRTWIGRLSGLTSPPSTVARGVAAWISSLLVSPASRSRRRATSAVLTTSVGSGLPLDGSSVTWDRDSSSWRTSPSLLDSGYLTSSPTLPSSGSMRSGVCSALPRLAHRTSANASGSWATPTAGDFRKSGNSPEAFAKGFNGTLTDQAVRNWPTPKARDMRGGSGSEGAMRRNSPDLPSLAAVHGHQGGTTMTDGESGPPTVDLNPEFVASLMGVPANWLTPSTSVETDSYQQWLHAHSLNSHDALVSISEGG